jgi:hypothetical protein
MKSSTTHVTGMKLVTHLVRKQALFHNIVIPNGLFKPIARKCQAWAAMALNEKPWRESKSRSFYFLL